MWLNLRLGEPTPFNPFTSFKVPFVLHINISHPADPCLILLVPDELSPYRMTPVFPSAGSGSILRTNEPHSASGSLSQSMSRGRGWRIFLKS
ncbi:Uncharacterized protein HZ326_19304 [Fusarium oxysporum f. sp. albedinis]|nr:Uncharacterized protein HZ326_19304 [Fusarium oxysporum f. sp. albedinis]